MIIPNVIHFPILVLFIDNYCNIANLNCTFIRKIVDRHAGVDDGIRNELDRTFVINCLIRTRCSFGFEQHNLVHIRVGLEQHRWCVKCDLWSRPRPISSQVVSIEVGHPLGPVGRLQECIEWVVPQVGQHKLTTVVRGTIQRRMVRLGLATIEQFGGHWVHSPVGEYLPAQGDIRDDSFGFIDS